MCNSLSATFFKFRAMSARRVMSLVFLLSLVGEASRAEMCLPGMLTEGYTPVGACLYFLALLQCFIVVCHFLMLLIRHITFTISRIRL